LIYQGGITSTANPLSLSEDIGKQMFDSKAKFVFTIPEFYDKVKKIKKRNVKKNSRGQIQKRKEMMKK
jgi:hypothetical protein